MKEIKIKSSQDADKVTPSEEEGVVLSAESVVSPTTAPAEDKEKVSPKVETKIVTWQFKKRNYEVITNTIDKLAEKTHSGAFRKRVIKARNWRVILDLSKPEDKELHDYLLSHKDINHEYSLLADRGKFDKVSEEGATLKKLMDMSIPQLMNCITDEELHEVGLMAGSIEKHNLVMAIMRKKKLV